MNLNVCGLASKLRFPEFTDFIENYDIIGLQECKTDDADELLIPGYKLILNNRQHLARYRSGGIALLVKNIISDFIRIDSSPQSKLIQWFTISSLITDTLWYCLNTPNRFQICT